MVGNVGDFCWRKNLSHKRLIGRWPTVVGQMDRFADRGSARRFLAGAAGHARESDGGVALRVAVDVSLREAAGEKNDRSRLLEEVYRSLFRR